MKKILITGITGFVGQYLAEALLSSQNEIHGTYHSEQGISRLGDLKDKITLHQVDLTQKEEVDDLIKQVKPDEIYHLAAQSSPAESFKDPIGTLSTNAFPAIFICESLRVHELLSTRVLMVSTSEVYGLVKTEDLPVDEETAIRPSNPYGVSKITQDYLALQYFLAYKLPIIRVRPFNHTGPRQHKTVVPTFAKQIVEIEKGLKEPIMKVGNLKAKKDFSDVRDVVRAYVLLMEKGEPGEVYNVGSGKSVQIKEILDMLLSSSGKEITVEVDPELFRPVDVEEVICDHSKISLATGWNPEIPLDQTMKDTLDYFRKLV